MWNDQQIKDLNPDIAHLLPAKPIYVATVTGSSAVGQLFTDMLSNTVPEFNATVRESSPPYVPSVSLALISWRVITMTMARDACRWE
jgi:hypothetical protein